MRIKNIYFLDKTGKVIKRIINDKKLSSDNIFPLVIENYIWDEFADQKISAEKYKDKIRRVFYPEEVDEQTKDVLQDDIQRLNIVGKFHYGQRVLEVGCSDGSASIKIAQLNHVKQVVGIDIRESAIEDGKELIKDLLRRRQIDNKVAGKITLKNIPIERIPNNWGLFDSVCTYEIFEHLTPWQLIPAFSKIYKFIKPEGKLFVSVPNRFPSKKYCRLGRSRWQWFDHRNFFSKLSLEIFLKNFFKKVRFHSHYEGDKIADGIYLIAQCSNKLHK